jgi:hypothetical protein
MAEECDEYDDGNRYAKQQEQNGTHWELSDFNTVIFLIGRPGWA